MADITKEELVILWFKRDLRLVDHEALTTAIGSGDKVLLLYTYEPSIWENAHYADRHANFVKESLVDLQSKLKVFGTKILCVRQEVLPALEKIQKQYTLKALYSSEESGLDCTYQRDLSVKKNLQNQRIPWYEFQTNGVRRAIRNRITWGNDWYGYMKRKIKPIALRADTFLAIESINHLEKSLIPLLLETPRHHFQKGGRTAGTEWRISFFEERLAFYSDYISKPEMSRYGCSRLSPYISWGNFSIRELYQQSIELKENSPYKRQLMAFRSRLRWQSHFIQKFESEPRMEFEAVNRGFLQMPQPKDEAKIKAWKIGMTGYPLVDAAVRCVAETGYINFRMRSMITSFFTHHLFQHFSHMSEWLARQFLDFEAGIHYGQIQMQSGLTGTNTLRVYNPTKNALDHDPEAIFIKKWVPELVDLPIKLAIEPWKITEMEMTLYDFVYGEDYPSQIVQIQETRKYALEQLYGYRKSELAKAEKTRILELHTIPRKK